MCNDGLLKVPSFFFISPCRKRTPCHPRRIKLSSAIHERSAVIKIFMQIPDDNRNGKREREEGGRRINCIDGTTPDMRKRDKINAHDGTIGCNSSSGRRFLRMRQLRYFARSGVRKLFTQVACRSGGISFASVGRVRPFLYGRQITINTRTQHCCSHNR